MKETAQILFEVSCDLGLLDTIRVFGNSIKVKIPLSNSFLEQSIDDLTLSVRARNGLMRNGSSTVGAVYEKIMSGEGLETIRNLGKKSVGEIKVAILTYAYEDLNDREKLRFWKDFVLVNDLPESIEALPAQA